MVKLSLVCSLLAAALLVSLAPAPAVGCASVAGRGEHVNVVDESALIIWDSHSHRMQFIRRATFASRADHFGFLVPTPSKPALSEVDDNLFTLLEDIIKPPVIQQHQTIFVPSLLLAPTFSREPQTASVKSGSAVRVLGTEHVASYDAAIISAEDAGELAHWLKRNGYVSSPALESWLSVYVRKKWIITAFKVSSDRQYRANPAAYAVRMAFDAETPYFPYREPASAREVGGYAGSRSLRVYVISAGKMSGAIGQANEEIPWMGELKWANSLGADRLESLQWRTRLSPRELPTGAWLCAFEDRSTPRQGTDDLFFRPAQDSTPVLPRPVTHTLVNKIYVPVDAVSVLILVTAVALRARRNRRQTSRAM